MSVIPELHGASSEAEVLQQLPEDVRERIKDRWRIYQLRHHPSWWRRLTLFLSLIGPGILVMIADNDAGGVITYAQTGAMYGIG
ncbi:MAG: divalent metal cation transporter, partial [Acidithiobacillus sp.]